MACVPRQREMQDIKKDKIIIDEESVTGENRISVDMDEDIIIIKVEDGNETVEGNEMNEDSGIYMSTRNVKVDRVCSEEMGIDEILIAKVETTENKSNKKLTNIAKDKSKIYTNSPSTATSKDIDYDNVVNIILKEENKNNKNFFSKITQYTNVEGDEDIFLIKVEGNDNECVENSRNSAVDETFSFVAKTDEKYDCLEGSDCMYLDDDEDFKQWKKAISNKPSALNLEVVEESECSTKNVSTCLQVTEDEMNDPSSGFSEENDDPGYLGNENESGIEQSVADKPVRRNMPPHNVSPSYTEQDMKDAVQAVLDGRMTRTQAVKSLKIGFRTFHKKTQEILGATLPRFEKRPDNKPFLKAMAAILKLTNATPFTSRGSLLYCAYCGSSSPRTLSTPFATAEAMRAHTRDTHPQTSFNDIVACMLPMKKHEILKLDIKDQHCKACSIDLSSWEQMWSHLESVHSVDLSPAKTRIVPYVLTSYLNDITCALCPEIFPTYLKLDSHISQHFPNYICVNCGDQFVSKIRFKAHITWCTEQRDLCCEQCGKLFHSQNCLNNHVVSVHSGKKCKFCKRKFYKPSNLLKHEKMHVGLSIACNLCPVKFENEKSFQWHLKKVHSITNQKRGKVVSSDSKVKKIKHACTSCDMTFDTDKYFVEHNRLVHGITGMVCTTCGGNFKSMDGLRSHKKRMHLGEGVFFQCQYCYYKFGAQDYLRKHMKRRHLDQYLKMKKLRDIKPRTQRDGDE